MRQTRGAAEKLFIDFAGDTVPVFDAALGVERRWHEIIGEPNTVHSSNGGSR